MRNRFWTAVLFAFIIPTLALAGSRALPQQLDVQHLFTVPVTVTAAGATAWSDPIPFSEEIVAMEYDSEALDDTGPVTLDFVYCNEKTGTYVSGTDTTSSGYMNSVTFNVTPTSGANVALFPARWVKVRLFNAGPTDFKLNRLSMARLSSSSQVPRPIKLGIGATLLSGGSSVDIADDGEVEVLAGKSYLVDAHEYKSISYRGSGVGVGNQIVRFDYSLSRTGPFGPWESQASAGYQNSFSGTDDDAFIDLKLFPAKYFKVTFRNESGDVYTLDAVYSASEVQLRQ